MRFVGSTESVFERFKVPQVTTASGTPMTVDSALTMFGRIDVSAREGHNITVEGLFAPRHTTLAGLSPLRSESASVDARGTTIFAGVTDRYIIGPSSTVQLRAGVFVHDMTISRRGDGFAFWSPDGWRGNWFSGTDRTAARMTASATWERRLRWRGEHDMTAVGSAEWRRLRTSIDDVPLMIEDVAGRAVRQITFGPPRVATTGDHGAATAVRDVWRVAERLNVDGGCGSTTHRSAGHQHHRFAPGCGMRWMRRNGPRSRSAWAASPVVFLLWRQPSVTFPFAPTRTSTR